jgi:S1-C subfamily serine protease
VYPKSPAEEAGLKRGDVILSVDGQEVENPDAFGYRFALKGVSGQAQLALLRAGGARTTLALKLATPPETRPRDPVRIKARSPFVGVTAVNLSPAVADELQLDLTTEGVAISEVEPNSRASEIGLQRGDLLIAVNGAQIGSTKELERAVQRGSQLWEIVINRGGQIMTSVQRG